MSDEDAQETQNYDEVLEVEGEVFEEEENEIQMEDDGEETVICDDNDGEIEYEVEADMTQYNQLQSIVHTYTAYMYTAPARFIEGKIIIDLPRSFLPLSMQAVYGYTVHPILLKLEIELYDFNWKMKPTCVSFKHPVYEGNFIGRPLVQDVIEKFFTPFYEPKSYYRAESYLLTPTGTADPVKLDYLVKHGYDKTRARSALILCYNDIEKSESFLKTGDISRQSSQVQIDYSQCPLLYFVFEVAEAFLDLSNHCCVCRKLLEIPGIKPSVCNDQFCTFRLTEIGVGNSVYSEIKRDPIAADLILSTFATAVKSGFLSPAPPNLSENEIAPLMDLIPSMDNIVNSCSNDQELSSYIGSDSMGLLRWVLLSNRSHLISLPPELRIKEINAKYQFLSLISSPEAEQEFKALKQIHGSIYLWHGSHGNRWHSILRNGLKNATGTKYQANGAALGEGIYFARDSGTSTGYCRACPNMYKHSILGADLNIIGLCEVVKVPQLKDHQWAHTLTNEKACIVRFLFTNGRISLDTVSNPPKNIPKLKDVLNYHANLA